MERRRIDGRTVYDVKLVGKNSESTLRVAEDGHVIASSSASASGTRNQRQSSVSTDGTRSEMSTRSGLRFEELPKSVQQTVENLKGGREVAGIERRTVNGEVAYRITFRRDGETTTAEIGEDGRTKNR